MLNKKFFLPLLFPFFTLNSAVFANDFSPENSFNYQSSELANSTFLITQNKPNFTDVRNDEFLVAQSESAQKLEVVGNTLFEEEIEEIIKSSEKAVLDFSTVKAIADQITQLYLNQGYITTRAIVANITPEVATIEVQEGEVSEIEVLGETRLDNYVRERIALGTETPLNAGDLEDQLRLLKNDPLIENIEASLRRGEEAKQSILTVRVVEADPFFGTVGIDNYSPPSIGDTQFVFNLGYGNVFGLGDSFEVAYRPRLENWFGTYNLDLTYTVPLNAMNGTLQARVSLQENEVVDGDFRDFDISGESQFYELIYRQPVLRNPREELAFSVGMSYRSGQTFLGDTGVPFGVGPDEDGNSRTNVLSFGQDYVKRDGGGAWAFRSQFRLGIGLLGVTEAEVEDNPDGFFFSWLGQVQRVQVLSPSNFLILQAELQLSDRPLLPSEQFVIGGGQSVRGYRQNVRAGDNGFRFSIEDRITVARNEEFAPVLQLAPFFDMGSVWNNVENPNRQPDETFVAALGLGIIWEPVEGLNLRVDYAPPLIDLIDRGNNIQDDGLYFSLKYNF